MNTHLLYYSIYRLRASCMESGQLGTGGDTERLHACMGSPVYDEVADRGRPQVSDHLERDVLSYDSKT